jgi:hypothetical protein
MLSQYTYLNLWLGIHIASNANHMESDLPLLIVTVIHVVLAKQLSRRPGNLGIFA